jgi:predicted nucleotidyltransferase component of viral defense system
VQDRLYDHQAHLLLRTLPLIHRYKEFAIKGGTAINFFYREMPRLSVDIDLTYLPLQNRKESLSRIDYLLNEIARDINHSIPGTAVIANKLEGLINRLTVSAQNAVIKIEPNLVIRGSVYPVVEKTITSPVSDYFELSVKSQVLSLADVYGGKICAALDRQHPRDLFDIKLLFESEGIKQDIKNAFIIYLISHPRPMIEILSPNFIPIEPLFYQEFEGMTFINITLNELINVRESLVKKINSRLSEKDKQFILSIKSGNPDWHLSPIHNAAELPAVKWKLMNIRKMPKAKRQMAFEKLKRRLEK